MVLVTFNGTIWENRNISQDATMSRARYTVCTIMPLSLSGAPADGSKPPHTSISVPAVCKHSIVQVICRQVWAFCLNSMQCCQLCPGSCFAQCFTENRSDFQPNSATQQKLVDDPDMLFISPCHTSHTKTFDLPIYKGNLLVCTAANAKKQGLKPSSF